MPLQTRIYLYDRKFRPRSAQDVHARMTLQLPKENVARQVSFQFVPMPAQATEQDYVVAVFDIRPLQDKEASITFEFSGPSNFSVRPPPSRPIMTASTFVPISHEPCWWMRIRTPSPDNVSVRSPVFPWAAEGRW